MSPHVQVEEGPQLVHVQDAPHLHSVPTHAQVSPQAQEVVVPQLGHLQSELQLQFGPQVQSLPQLVQAELREQGQVSPQSVHWQLSPHVQLAV